MIDDLFVEIVIEAIDGVVIRSDLRPATMEDITMAQEAKNAGDCPHNIIKDTTTWLYDIRSCATCGAGLGIV
jgi:hypothetical protein